MNDLMTQAYAYDWVEEQRRKKEKEVRLGDWLIIGDAWVADCVGGRAVGQVPKTRYHTKTSRLRSAMIKRAIERNATPEPTPRYRGNRRLSG